MDQWKTGIGFRLFAAVRDIDFEIKGKPKLSLNTGEYAYVEIAPGQYQYKGSGKTIFANPKFATVEFEANKNYSFIVTIIQSFITF